MSKLEYYARPLVAFDATNKEHRRFYHQFVKTKSWGHCPVRFICPDSTGMDLISMIEHELIDYYVTQEFKKSKPLPKRGPMKHRKSIGITAGGFELKVDSR
jgi:hypothetical protein